MVGMNAHPTLAGLASDRMRRIEVVEEKQSVLLLPCEPILVERAVDAEFLVDAQHCGANRGRQLGDRIDRARHRITAVPGDTGAAIEGEIVMLRNGVGMNRITGDSVGQAYEAKPVRKHGMEEITWPNAAQGVGSIGHIRSYCV
jgi:hypothetical protein